MVQVLPIGAPNLLAHLESFRGEFAGILQIGFCSVLKESARQVERKALGFRVRDYGLSSVCGVQNPQLQAYKYKP